MKEFLQETRCIDFSDSMIQKKIVELKNASTDEIDYRNNSSDLDKRLADILDAAECVMNIRTDFDLQ